MASPYRPTVRVSQVLPAQPAQLPLRRGLRKRLRTDDSVFELSSTQGEPAGYCSAKQVEGGMINVISSRNHYAFNLGWMLQPAKTDDASADGVAHPPALRQEEQDQLAWVVAQFKQLPALKKPHLGRPACWYTGAPLHPLQRALLREYARVLRVLPHCGYPHEPDGPCAEVKIAKEVGATFNIQL